MSDTTAAAVTRETVTIPGVDGTAIHAWVHRPAAPHPAPTSAVVLAHGIGGVKAAGLESFAEAFAAAGHLALTFDYRHWGASGGEPREMLSLTAQRDDYRSALAHARSLPGIDPQSVFVWGTSFAGMHVLELAAEDPDLAGAIAQCPLVDGLAGMVNMPPLQGLCLTAVAVADRLGARLGRAPRYLPLIAAPGDRAVITTEDALPGQAQIAPRDGSPWPNRITARSLLDATFARPVRRARRARCPLLMVVAQDDTMAPVRPAVRAAAEAPRGELYRSIGGHYDVYAGGADHAAVLTVEIGFLARHTPRRPGPAQSAAATAEDSIGSENIGKS